MSDLLKSTNDLGAAVTLAFYLSAILIFVSRLAGRPRIGYWIGIFEISLSLPLAFLLFTAPGLARPPLYYIQVGLLLLWILTELLLDYILRIDFRRIRWAVIAYVTLFFAGAGGMLGIALPAGKGAGLISIVLFFIMASLAFIQRGVTGR